MTGMSSLHADVTAFEQKLASGAGHLVDEFRSLVAKLLGEAETDADDVAQEAQDAAGPVVSAVEADGEQLVKDAVADVEAVAGGSEKPSA